jgi:hypothetical protein
VIEALGPGVDIWPESKAAAEIEVQMVRFLVVAALIAASMYVAKETGVLTRTRLMGYCTNAQTPAGSDGNWRACHSGLLSSRPSLYLEGCESRARDGDIEYWRCPGPAKVSARLAPVAAGTTKKAASAGPPPAVRDAVAIADAAGSTDGDEAAGSVYELLDVATKAGTARGALLIRQRLPALAARIDAAAPIVHERLLGVGLTTSVGRKCRVAVLRLVAQEQWLFRTFDDEVARNRSTSTAVDRFTARWQALGRWWAAQVTACSAGAGPGERADVEGAMHSL